MLSVRQSLESSCNKDSDVSATAAELEERTMRKQPAVSNLCSFEKLSISDSQDVQCENHDICIPQINTPQGMGVNPCRDGFKHTTSTTSFDSAYSGSKPPSTADIPGVSQQSEPNTPPQDIPVEKPLLVDQGQVLSTNPQHLEQDSPVRNKKKRLLPFDADYPQLLASRSRRRSFSVSSPCAKPKVFTRMHYDFLQQSLSDGELNKTKSRKNASRLTRDDEKNLEKTVTKRMKAFVRLTDFVILMACLYSRRLICSSDAEYLTNDKHTPREKANYFYMVVLPKKGRKAYRLLYECLSEEYEHRGHRQLVHILDKAIGYMQDSTSESSLSSSEVRVDQNESSPETGSVGSAMVYSSTESLNEWQKSSQARYGNDPLKHAGSDDA